MKEKIENILETIFDSSEYSKVGKSGKGYDYQINSIFKMAKEKGKNPIEIGDEITKKINELTNFSEYFKEVSFAKPGFINIKVSDTLINNTLIDIKNDENVGITKIDENITCVLDYGGPNVAKPLHVGHIRPAIIGESINRILKSKGYKTIGDVHLGDIAPVSQVMYGIYKKNIKEEDISVDLFNWLYPEMNALSKSDDLVRAEMKEISRKIQDSDPSIMDLYNKICDISKKDIASIYDYLDVKFDIWYGEHIALKYVPNVIEYMEQKNIVEDDDGAQIIRVEKETDKKLIPPLILVSSDDTFMYGTTDLATIYQRMKDFNPEYILYIVDDRQRLHFETVFRVCEKSGLTKETNLEHNYFGTMNGPGGKPFKTRDGGTLGLKKLIKMTEEGFIAKKEENKNMSKEDIKKIANSILKFADLQNNRQKDYIFDIEKFSDINGKTGPYILYAALRIKKLITDNEKTNSSISNTIYNEQDRDLRMKLLEVNDIVTKAADERMPHYIADYLYDLSVITNTFYQNNNISKINDKIQLNDWLNLLEIAYTVIEQLLNLLIIEIPSEM